MKEELEKWEAVVEEGETFWIHPTHGNVFKHKDGTYSGMFPKVCSMGPFKTVEQAQKVLETCKQRVSQAIDVVNEEIVEESKGE